MTSMKSGKSSRVAGKARTNHTKRDYSKVNRKCGVCGAKHPQGNMIRDIGSSTGWICVDCDMRLRPDYED